VRDRVTITGRRERVLKDAVAGLGTAGYVCFDASDPAAVAAGVELVPERVDVLVNNAGGKAAIEAWTADLAAELGPRGITANVVSPA
jgi:3-oxoacyl-[acyl-carrier protein] reductase